MAAQAQAHIESQAYIEAQAPAQAGLAAPAADTDGPGDVRKRRRSALSATFLPLLLDIGVPVGGYYLLRDGFGMSLVMSLALSSVVPGLRTLVAALRERRFNGLAGLMVVVNVLSLALTFVTGDPRLMVAKDSGTTSVVGVAVIVAALRGTPMMSTGMKPFLTRGRADRIAAWDRLTAASPRFCRLELRFSLIWGVVLLVECVTRVVGAYTLPVSTMVWAGNVIAFGGIGLGILVTGPLASHPMDLMLRSETRRRDALPTAGRAAA